MHWVILTVCLVIGVTSAAEAQEGPPWIVRMEAGRADHHKLVPDRKGAIAGVRVARVWARDRVRLDFGGAGSSADEGFFTADVGLELRLCRPDCRLTLFVAAFVGTLAEPTYGHSGTSRIGGGIDIRLAPRHALRVAAYGGRHDRAARGPHTILIGYSRAFGRN
jgi:hypothetical protein